MITRRPQPLRPPDDTRSRARSTVHFESPLLTVGTFRARPHHRDFASAGPMDRPTVVFPRTAVWIEHADRRPFVADPTVVTLYNLAQPYRRRELSEEGDRCDWFALAPSLAAELAQRSPRFAAAGSDGPFPMPRAAVDPALCLRQRLLSRQLDRAAAGDRLQVEEEIVALLGRVLADSELADREPGSRTEGGGPSARARRHRELAEAAKSTLARRFRDDLSLSELAAELDTSVGHLCRVFRATTGQTLHRYRTQLRLRSSLDQVLDPGRDLSDLAFELGFSSHSHFTHQFRSLYGAPPTAVRAAGHAPH